MQVTAVDSEGRNFVDTAVRKLVKRSINTCVTLGSVQSAGDLWYFPPGIPHSLQATDADPDGTEFLLVCSLSFLVWNAAEKFVLRFSTMEISAMTRHSSYVSSVVGSYSC